MKKLILTLAIVLGVFGLTACGNPTVVNTKAGKITQNDFYKELKSEYGNQVIQNMVYTKLLESKYTATTQEINDKIKYYQNQVGGASQLSAYLAQNGMTMTQFKKSVKTQVLMFKAQTAGIKVTDQDLQDYFNKNKDNYIQYKASHILVSSKSKADSILKQLQNGADFATLAKKYSTDTGSATNGGDLGWIPKTNNNMDPKFSAGLFKLTKVGELSPVVQSSFGYHIIKVTGIKDKLSDFKSQVKTDYLTSKEKNQQVVLNDLIKNGNIKVNDTQFKNLFKQKPVTSTTPSGSSSSSSSTPAK